MPRRPCFAVPDGQKTSFLDYPGGRQPRCWCEASRIIPTKRDVDHPSRTTRASPGATAVIQRRILVVDDDPRLLHIVEMYLGIEGYEVRTASNGEEGLREVDAQRPDLIILDIMMPGMDGLEACRRTRGNSLPAD